MNAGHVYVLAFSDGTVKVGQTKDAGKRLNAHRSDGRKFGLAVTGEWVSPLHTEWLANEGDLKLHAARLGGTSQREEYFKGVEFAAVVDKAQALTFTPPEAEEEKATEPDGRWAALKDNLVGRIKHAEATAARYSGPAEVGLIFYAAALADIQKRMGQIEAEYPEPAST